MRIMRNRLLHAYFEIDEKLLWDPIQNDFSWFDTLLEKII